jgi:dTMP kinase
VSNATGRGRFITLEGGEGAGKSTNLEHVHQILVDAGLDVVLTREPGGTPLAEKIRDLLLDHKQTRMADDTELLLMFAARAQHLHEKIIPALEAGQWVLCDRFTDASFAYQGGGRQMDKSRIEMLEQWVQGELQPDLTLLLDIPVEQGMARAGARGELDRFEREQQDFFVRVRQAYLQRAEAAPGRFRIIDASQPLDVVKVQISSVMQTFLGRE